MVITPNEYALKIDKMRLQDNSFGTLAKELSNLLKRQLEAPNAQKLAKMCFVSNSRVTQFVKQIGLENYKELVFLHKAAILPNTEAHDVGAIFKAAAKHIMEARKIQFIGVSNSHITNLDFASKLSRMDKWVAAPFDKYEQIGISRLLTSSDVVIINSISFQHLWMRQIIDKTPAFVIVITAARGIKTSNGVIFKIESEENSGLFRIYTIKNRSLVQNVYDKIFFEIYSFQGNKELLKLTSYK